MKPKKNIVVILILIIFTLSACAGSSSRNSAMGRQALSTAKEGQKQSAYRLGPQYELQLEDMISQEVYALENRKEDIPLELNQQVLANINYFLNDGSGFMERSLNRGQKYIPMMKAIFKQKGLPEELVYLALIESGFRNQAVSHASAVGPWQFIASTGRNYGLLINEWVDERRDPVKATYAAADYLNDLHDMFNSWPLAIAAYNSGEGKIQRGIKNYSVRSFWDMADSGGYLAKETKLYVPMYLAAAIIGKDPAAYGFNIQADAPEKWDEVIVPTPISLSMVANLTNSNLETIKDLNPHLKKETTPQNERNFILRIPQNSSKNFQTAYAKLPENQLLAQVEVAFVSTENVKDTRTQNVKSRPEVKSVIEISDKPKKSKTQKELEVTQSNIKHKVRKGENLSTIANLYGVSTKNIIEANNITGNKINAGEILNINSNLALTATSKVVGKKSELRIVREEVPEETKSVAQYYTVKTGDSLSKVAQKHGLTTKKLMELNNLKNNKINVGQKLAVGKNAAATKGETTASPSSYTVLKGDSLSSIAQKHGTTTKNLMELNNLKNNKINVGQKLAVSKNATATTATTSAATKVETANKTSATATKGATTATTTASPSSYTVLKGDSLSSIAQKHGITTKNLMELNNLKDNKINIGQKLAVSKNATATTAATSATTKVETTSKTSATATKGATTATTTASPSSYTVLKGDSLSSIAQKHGITTKNLMELNNLKDNKINIGQKLAVSKNATATTAATSATTKVETTSKTSATATKGATTATTTASPSSYTVLKGDSLSSIAQKHATTTKNLIELNNLKNNKINVGQKLAVNKNATATTAATSATTKVETASKTSATATKGATTATTTASPSSYTVLKGDSLSSIAQKHATTTKNLMELNKLSDNKIKIGQVLKVK